ncbi:MAG: D-alanine--D-alanine ligase, partial [Atopostipes sp.]|nr:D-alanine--D-alanine ligase [Atopostipes sp.]
SVISAYHIMQEIYYDYYEVLPIYLTKDGDWLEGDRIETKEDLPSLSELQKPGGSPFNLKDLKTENSIAFPVLHGPNGEDGTIQGLFEMMNIPYIGSGVLASAAGMDKIVSKTLFQEAGIPIVPYERVTPTDWETRPEKVLDRIAEKLTYPIYVKPANLGSSVGISEVNNREELENGIELALTYDHRVLVEEGIQGSEIEVAILGNEDVHTSVVGSLIKESQFYDYESKYIDQNVKLEIPAELPKNVSKKIRKYAAKAFIAIDGSGLSRVDFFVTEEYDIYINEINTFPGFTPISMYPKLWEETGLAYGDLIEELIQLGIQKHQLRNMNNNEEK